MAPPDEGKAHQREGEHGEQREVHVVGGVVGDVRKERRAAHHEQQVGDVGSHDVADGDGAGAVHEEVCAKDEQGEPDCDDDKAEGHVGPFGEGLMLDLVMLNLVFRPADGA